jgi:hypothetical protein
VFFSTPLIAVDPALQQTVYYQLIAGNLPAGIQIQQTGLLTGVPKATINLQGVPAEVSRNVTSRFAVRAYTQTTINNVTVINQLADRTFSLTITGQDAPQFITPAGQLTQIYDGSLVEGIQIEYTNTDPDETVVIKLVAGALPPGLTISPAGLISGFVAPNPVINQVSGYSRDGQGFDQYPYDFTTQSISLNFEFVLEVTDGKVGGSNLRSFSIYVWSRNSLTADNTFITADGSPVRIPIILIPQGSIGTVLSNDGSGTLTWDYVPRLYYALQRTFINYNVTSSNITLGATGATGANFTILPFSSQVEAAGIVDDQLKKVEYNYFNMRKQGVDDILTCVETGWYQISYYLHHPSINMNATSDGQEGLGSFTIGIKFSDRVEYTTQDLNGSTPDTCNYIATLWLTNNDVFEFVFQTESSISWAPDSEDFLVRISILRLTNGTGNVVF